MYWTPSSRSHPRHEGRGVGYRRVAQLIAEIDTAMQEQTAGIGQIGDAVSQLDHVTQQNAALVEESAASAESLNQQANKMTGSLVRSSLLDGGEGCQRFARADADETRSPSQRCIGACPDFCVRGIA